ncbi:hypothetical protein ABZ422_07525 [Micromonospora zamorensis]|uniref:hypothetical protein n=1 Tax=Micromonospora zamorensis TaxID=709883 RepID=UPI00082002BF|nr:hypothetical protein [Micromonospora zamorensis]WSK46694.1 hypothetical protein OG423_22050 [Micromonospora zamorensis]SCG35724.1 hypothetical protein GA0070619_0237 [Micromonospora zamorensis]
MTNQELRLSVGASPGQRTVAVLSGVFVATIGAAFVALPLIAGGLLRRLTGPGDAFASYEEARDLPPGMLPPALRDSGAGAESNSVPVVGLCGLPFLLLGVYLVLRVLRTAAWLEGSRARVRGAFTTRTVDLATARIDTAKLSYRGTGEDDTPMIGQRLRAIVATDRASNRRVIIPLRGMGLGSLPPPELRALADAITTGRPVDGRDDAHTVADQLRRLAAHPLAE